MREIHVLVAEHHRGDVLLMREALRILPQSSESAGA
jgi:hypothetical protein